MPVRLYSFLISLINLALYFVGLFISLRIILRLFSANSTTPIVSWIYTFSGFLISPFAGIFPDFRVGVGALDVVAIIALAGYTILGLLLAELFRGLTRPYLTQVTPATIHYHDVDPDKIGVDEDVEEEEEKPRHHLRRKS